MLVEQPNDIGVEAIEVSDAVDQILIMFHLPIIFKILDFVK
jgi:hypothetical protein